MSDENISELGDNVFFNCEKLNEVTFSDNNMLAKIGNRAFYGCVSLSEIKINNPNCVINENNDTFSENTILRGWSKSTTNDYSKKNGERSPDHEFSRICRQGFFHSVLRIQLFKP